MSQQMQPLSKILLQTIAIYGLPYLPILIHKGIQILHRVDPAMQDIVKKTNAYLLP